MSKPNKRFKWTVEFEVDEVWVEDGFDLTDDRALDMLAHDLRYANIGAELKAKVIKRPSRAAILKVQGYTDEQIKAVLMSEKDIQRGLDQIQRR